MVGGTLAGGFWLGASLPEQAFAATIGRFNAYLEIDADGVIHITCPQSEMGQGIHDGLPKILAEELEARWEDVRVRMPSADDAFVNPITKRHRTANSESTTIYYGLLRTAGASARDMLIAAAAQRWAVAVSECRASASRVTHTESGAPRATATWPQQPLRCRSRVPRSSKIPKISP